MKKKVSKLALASAGLLSVFVSSAQAQDLFTGDVRLACEAILCLSSSQRPGECSPSLTRYFDISHTKWSDTLQGRIDFLNMCPTAHDVNAGMPGLVNAIANGAGRCDSAYLNRYLARTERKSICEKKYGDESCRTVEVNIIDTKKPYWCSAYETHGYTDITAARYVGTPENNGRWVDGDKFDAEQAKWQAEQDKLKNDSRLRWGK